MLLRWRRSTEHAPNTIFPPTNVLQKSYQQLQQRENLPANPLTEKAIEGARLLRSEMRDIGSFGIEKVWIMHSEKYSDAVCYEYHSRNGYGGMNRSEATYAPHTKKDVAKDKYILETVDQEPTSPFGLGGSGLGFASRCGPHAEKHDTFVKDVTVEVNDALNEASD
jgi:hypothetical protein